jgi:cell division protein FtsX
MNNLFKIFLSFVALPFIIVGLILGVFKFIYNIYIKGFIFIAMNASCKRIEYEFEEYIKKL